MSNPEARVWATSTDLPNTRFERKQYFIILEDAGKPDLRFILQRHADGNIIAVPYAEADYDYTEYDPEWEEGDDDGDYYDCEVSDDDEPEDDSTGTDSTDDA